MEKIILKAGPLKELKAEVALSLRNLGKTFDRKRHELSCKNLNADGFCSRCNRICPGR